MNCPHPRRKFDPKVDSQAKMVPEGPGQQRSCSEKGHPKPCASKNSPCFGDTGFMTSRAIRTHIRISIKLDAEAGEECRSSRWSFRFRDRPYDIRPLSIMSQRPLHNIPRTARRFSQVRNHSTYRQPPPRGLAFKWVDSRVLR